MAAILISSMVMVAFTTMTSAQQGQPSPTEFFQNGTGIVYFANGTILHFNHTLTPQNGYLYDNGTIYYTSNGSQVDLTKVDKNSLIITDIIQPQQQQQQPPQQQQPTPPPISERQARPLIPIPPPPTPGSPAASDPALQRFDQIFAECKTRGESIASKGNSYDMQRQDQCVRAIKQGISQYCENLQTYDAVKCDYVNRPEVSEFLAINNYLYGFG
jgi:hypothetical protein